MNTFLHKYRRCLSVRMIAGLIGLTALTVVASAADDPVVQTNGKISYVSGGVGDESIVRLNSLAAKFNLKLVFALKSGAYASDVRVVIGDGKGQTLLDTTSDGPWFLVNLPAGKYDVAASFAGKTEKRRITLGNNTPRRIDFRWNSE